MSQVFNSSIDLFYSQLQDYKRGANDVQFSRYDDHMKKVTNFIVTFNNMPALAPRGMIVRDLDELYDHLARSQAFIQSLTQLGHGIEFEIVMSDHFFSRMGNLLPPIISAAGSSVTPIKFVAPEKKPVKIKTERKVRTEVLVGYRDFVYLKKGNQSRPMLLSRNGVPWPRYEPLVASCNGDPFVTHDAPSVGCQCGIYAYNKPDNAKLKQDATIWGEIALWGKVLICPDGYRAEFAYPQNIFIKDVGTKTVRTFASAIEKEYGVPVHLVKVREGKTATELMAKMVDDWIRKQIK